MIDYSRQEGRRIKTDRENDWVMAHPNFAGIEKRIETKIDNLL